MDNCEKLKIISGAVAAGVVPLALPIIGNNCSSAAELDYLECTMN